MTSNQERRLVTLTSDSGSPAGSPQLDNTATGTGWSVTDGSYATKRFTITNNQAGCGHSGRYKCASIYIDNNFGAKTDNTSLNYAINGE
jgi:hypothetical protein